MNKFPFEKQLDIKDCGPTCIRIISKFYGRIISLQTIRNLSETTREGSSLYNLSNASEALGYRSLGAIINFNSLKNEVVLPCIVHWNKNHFIVVYKIDKNDNVYVSDPSYGLISYTKKEFIEGWTGNGNLDIKSREGIVLLLEPTESFYSQEDEDNKEKTKIRFILNYFLNYKKLLTQVLIGLFTASLLSLILPFLTQSIVDIGIQNENVSFINLILIAQFMIFAGRIGIDIIRNWALLHISARVNISLVSDFFIKLMALPIDFFDTRMTGDLLQRIKDHDRVELLFKNSSLSTLFSIINLLIFSITLIFYDYRLFVLNIIGALLYIAWINFFMNKRRELDCKRFSQISQEQSKVLELINGMQDIKLYNAERQKRWSWEYVQIRLFKTQLKSYSLEQVQSVGGSTINQIKDILIIFFSSKLVMSGEITLGMMLSVQYVIGQLNAPLLQLIEFVKQYQDARISLERIGEIHSKENEIKENQGYNYDIPQKDIELRNVSFRYMGREEYVFEDLNINIPYKKTTAIVGASGSGKTTLLKLLMKFYEPIKGNIKIGNIDLKNISPKYWRQQCGIVMQEGYIFNDTIAENIALGEEYIDKQRLRKAVEIANIKDFIEELPLSYNTKIGNEGIGISGGQKQRLFIARAVYKSPNYIFFDEATSALDANNEKIIMENLQQFFKGKTAVVIAHRLSTVKNADKIIVLDKGRVVEEGTHVELVAKKGEYYRLVKNQLELGN